MKKSMGFGRPYKILISPSKKRRVNRWTLLILIVTAICYCIVSTLTHIYPVIQDVSENLLDAHATKIINESVLDSFGSNEYGQIMDIAYDDAGKINSITANASDINKLKSEMTINILNSIDQFSSKGFTVPLGNLTDIILLSGVGPQIPFRIIPYGNVSVDFRNEFVSAGVNQTYHCVYIDVSAKLHAISAVATVESNVKTSVLVSQNIIIGDTPNFFADVTN